MKKAYVNSAIITVSLGLSFAASNTIWLFLVKLMGVISGEIWQNMFMGVVLCSCMTGFLTALFTARTLNLRKCLILKQRKRQHRLEIENSKKAVA